MRLYAASAPFLSLKSSGWKNCRCTSSFQRDMQLPVWSGDEVPVFLEACAYHGERGSLHTAYGVVRRSGGCRQGAARVHAHQPVGLRTAVGGGIEAVVSASLPEVRHALADGLVGKRGDPQPSEGLGIAQIRIYPPEDKFPSRPASVATMMLSHLENTSSMILSCLPAAMSVTIPCPCVSAVAQGGTVRESSGGLRRWSSCSRMFPAMPATLNVPAPMSPCSRFLLCSRPFFCSPDYAGYVLTDTRFLCYDCYHDSDKI